MVAQIVSLNPITWLFPRARADAPESVPLLVPKVNETVLDPTEGVDAPYPAKR